MSASFGRFQTTPRGACRGADYISSTKSGRTTVGFPIYDAHGNMTACLFRSGSNYYSLANQRHYDARGAIRNGAISGDPKGRYCASLGHKQDDESGLVYMRARYYEPSSGRFLSQDRDFSGRNWFVYASDQPIDQVDKSGRDTIIDVTFSMDINSFLEGIAEDLGYYLQDLAESDVTNVVENNARPVNGFFRDFLEQAGEDPDKWRYSFIQCNDGQGLSGTLKILYSDQMEEADLIKSIWSEEGDLASHSLPYIS